MKARCPSCGYIADSLPPTHKCTQCEAFSHDWLIYDWDSFALTKRKHIKYNFIIIALSLANLLAVIALKSADARQLLLSLLLIPAMISWLYCWNQLRREAEYEGHKGRATLPWFSGF